MSLLQSLRLALKSLASSKVRAFLTMLGIIIGVASVIILVSLMDGMSRQMTDEFSKMGTNRLTVEVFGMGPSRTVGPDDLDKLYRENQSMFAAMSPTVSLTVRTTRGTTELKSTKVIGVGEQHNAVDKLTLSQGRFLGYIDVSRRSKVCVVGSYVANQAFRGRAVGQIIKLSGDEYKIIGVLEKKANGEKGSDDDRIFVPYTLSPALGGGEVSSFTFSTASADKNPEAKSVIDQKLYEIFKSRDAYYIMDNAEMVTSINQMNKTMTLVLVGIAGISLLVGGIGIMNIMLVSVTERTREIGIRKSLGAKRRDIMSQFVIEAATTSTIGGLIGIALGAGVSVAAGKLMNMNVSPSMGAMLMSFSISAGIGVFFGFMPARRAARLNPIDALRYD